MTIATIASSHFRGLTGRHRLLGAYASRLGTRNFSSGTHIHEILCCTTELCMSFNFEVLSLCFDSDESINTSSAMTSPCEPRDAADMIIRLDLVQQHPIRSRISTPLRRYGDFCYDAASLICRTLRHSCAASATILRSSKVWLFDLGLQRMGRSAGVCRAQQMLLQRNHGVIGSSYELRVAWR